MQLLAEQVKQSGWQPRHRIVYGQHDGERGRLLSGAATLHPTNTSSRAPTYTNPVSEGKRGEREGGKGATSVARLAGSPPIHMFEQARCHLRFAGWAGLALPCP
eukprot:scaffold31180_cov40-Tisochrysis_lutea.AAC.1